MWNTVCKLTYTNLTVMQNFEVKSDRIYTESAVKQLVLHKYKIIITITATKIIQVDILDYKSMLWPPRLQIFSYVRLFQISLILRFVCSGPKICRSQENSVQSLRWISANKKVTVFFSNIPSKIVCLLNVPSYRRSVIID